MAWFQERNLKNGKKRIRAVVRVRGQKSVSETFANRTKAKRWAEWIKTEIEDGRYFRAAEAKKHTLNELIERYEKKYEEKLQSAKQESQIRWWKEQIGHLLLSDLTVPLIGEYAEKLSSEITVRKKPRSPGTVRRYLAALSHVLSVAVKEYQWMTENPVKIIDKPPIDNGRVRWLNDDERSKLLDACRNSSNSHLYPVVILALSTGMRQGEIMNLKWPDVDLGRARIILHRTKNGERRSVPLTGPALDVLKELDKRRRIDTQLLFPSKENPIQPIDIRFPWETALRASGVPDFRFHDLRHTAASYLAMNGVNELVIADILGHKTLQMVRRYAHLSHDHKALELKKMNEKYLGA